jgi:uncharacterized protein YbjQ (UPF0145 family)
VSFTSNLTVAEHHAVRSVGFTPVGQVLGTCVYSIGNTSSWRCGYRFGADSRTVEVDGLREALYKARHLALQRMRDETRRVRGDGVVAVRLSMESYEGFGLEFRALGTAVRADAGVRPPHPFTSDLSGQEFVQVIGAGWVPAALVLGIAVTVRHDDFKTRSQTSTFNLLNQEIDAYTDVTTRARARARTRLAEDTARYCAGATAIVREMSLQVSKLDSQFTQALYDARELAMERMQREAEALAAEGIVGVQLSQHNHAWGGHTTEFFAVGTAVRPIRPDHVVPAPQLVLGLER